MAVNIDTDFIQSEVVFTANVLLPVSLPALVSQRLGRYIHLTTELADCSVNRDSSHYWNCSVGFEVVLFEIEQNFKGTSHLTQSLQITKLVYFELQEVTQLNARSRQLATYS